MDGDQAIRSRRYIKGFNKILSNAESYTHRLAHRQTNIQADKQPGRLQADKRLISE